VRAHPPGVAPETSVECFDSSEVFSALYRGVLPRSSLLGKEEGWGTSYYPPQRDDTRFFTEVHLLPGKLLLVVAMHPLDGSRANQLSRVELSVGAAHPLARWGSSKPRAPLE
jgi:hypothetical protein